MTEPMSEEKLKEIEDLLHQYKNPKGADVAPDGPGFGYMAAWSLTRGSIEAIDTLVTEVRRLRKCCGLNAVDMQKSLDETKQLRAMLKRVDSKEYRSGGEYCSGCHLCKCTDCELEKLIEVMPQ